MSIQFQSLFTMQIKHDYYDLHDRRCNDFSIEPTSDCEMLMKNLRMLYKNYYNRFLTVITCTKEVNETPPPTFHLSPFIDVSNGLVLRYYLKLKNLNFSNFTSIALPLSDRKRFYFSNLSKNKIGTTLSLSNAIEPFTLSKMYSPGDLVKGPDGNFYEAIRLSDGTTDSKDITNSDYWKQALSNSPYVNGSDHVTLVESQYTYRLKIPSTNVITKIFALNKADNNLPYDILVETIEKAFSQTQETVAVDLSKKAPGKYRIVVNSEEDVWVYVDPLALRSNVFGIIEIHHFEKVPMDFRILTPFSHVIIPEPVFTIHFKNRSVIWKYISLNGDIGVLDSNVPPNNFIPSSGTLVKSEKAIALTESPVSTLTATRTGTGRQIKNLKNPEIGKLSFEKEGETGFFSGNMFLKIDT
jgi:hypothetical protein